MIELKTFWCMPFSFQQSSASDALDASKYVCKREVVEQPMVMLPVAGIQGGKGYESALGESL